MYLMVAVPLAPLQLSSPYNSPPPKTLLPCYIPPPTHPHTFLCKNMQEKFELKLPKIAGNWLKSVTV